MFRISSALGLVAVKFLNWARAWFMNIVIPSIVFAPVFFCVF